MSSKILQASLVLCTLFFSMMILLMSFNLRPEDWREGWRMYVQYQSPSNKPNPKMKTLLLWTRWYNDPWRELLSTGLNWEGEQHTDLSDFGCDHESYMCTITTNRSYLEDESLYDGFIFHEYGFNNMDIPDQTKRKVNQLYIFNTMEAPDHNRYFMNGQTLLPNINNNFYNATMTYSLQSDVHTPYGKIDKVREHPTGQQLDEYIAEYGRQNARYVIPKNFTSVILISNCESKSQREKMVSDLGRVVPLDCFGDCCTPFPYGGFDASADFWIEQHTILARTYQFYFAFENSNCKDYVSERFFHVLHADMIPVVMNGANMSRIAPPHSYIDVKDFATIKELGSYLQKVSSTPSLYASYFWWRNHYDVQIFVGRNRAKLFCAACRYLHTAQGPRIVEDLQKEWVDWGECHLPNITFIDEEREE